MNEEYKPLEYISFNKKLEHLILSDEARNKKFKDAGYNRDREIAYFYSEIDNECVKYLKAYKRALNQYEYNKYKLISLLNSSDRFNFIYYDDRIIKMKIMNDLIKYLKDVYFYKDIPAYKREIDIIKNNIRDLNSMYDNSNFNPLSEDDYGLRIVINALSGNTSRHSSDTLRNDMDLHEAVTPLDSNVYNSDFYKLQEFFGMDRSTEYDIFLRIKNFYNDTMVLKKCHDDMKKLIDAGKKNHIVLFKDLAFDLDFTVADKIFNSTIDEIKNKYHSKLKIKKDSYLKILNKVNENLKSLNVIDNKLIFK